MKELVGQAIADRVRDGEIIGVGTGSTVDKAVEKIGERVAKEGLHIKVVTTSYKSAWDCEARGLEVLFPWYSGEISWGFDGADEVTPEFAVVKGQGGAMLPEKILALKCKHFVIIVDQSKLVSTIGERFPIPVETIPAARVLVEKELRALGAESVVVREGKGKHGPIITEAGNIIIDVHFAANFKRDLKLLGKEIKVITGVVEHGLFVDLVDEVLVATAQGVKRLERVVA